MPLTLIRIASLRGSGVKSCVPSAIKIACNDASNWAGHRHEAISALKLHRLGWFNTMQRNRSCRFTCRNGLSGLARWMLARMSVSGQLECVPDVFLGAVRCLVGVAEIGEAP